MQVGVQSAIVQTSSGKNTKAQLEHQIKRDSFKLTELWNYFHSSVRCTSLGAVEIAPLEINARN